ncbi:MAG TPA: nitroreductase/quinone reductase family protein [Acidimicrobiales bacterium]|nr:nitroreductase/quinone reductase family protein [Acidimicrobiales bacterium]
MTTTARYVRPQRFDVLVNRFVGWLARRGIGLAGARILAVPGRTSGAWRTTVLNPMELDGERFLVAPRGETQWVRNLRVAGGGELRLGRRTEAFRAVEVDDGDKAPVLRAYLDRWGWEVGRFFEDLTPDSDDEALARVAPGIPVFRLT